jgi:uncharacterized protein YndB with AHSA1/START domain
METHKTNGLSEKRSFQTETRKTFAIPLETIWDFLLSQKGLAVWLGEINPTNFEVNNPYRTKEGIKGEVNSIQPYSHIYLSWKPVHWINSSDVQMKVINTRGKSTLSFLHDKLLSNDQREEMRRYWENIIQKIENQLTN